MVDVYLLRHAHVDYAPPAQITAHNPLTSLGHKMAARLAERCEGWDLQYLFVSTMLRAQQTADAISQRFPNLPRLDMPELVEVSFDDLQGFLGQLPSEDMYTWEEPHWAYARLVRWERVTAGWKKIQRIIEVQRLERVAIVCHGGPINALLWHFLWKNIDRLVDKKPDCWFELDWAATSCLSYTAERRWLHWVNDAQHIDDLRHLLPTPTTDS